MDLKLTSKVAEDGFDPRNGLDYQVIIEVGDNNFRFCIAREGDRKCLWLEDYTAESFLRGESLYECIAGLVAAHPFLSTQEWRAVKVVVSTPFFYACPFPAFQKGVYAKLSQVGSRGRCIGRLQGTSSSFTGIGGI